MSLALAFAPALRPFRATRLRLVGPPQGDGASVPVHLALVPDAGTRAWTGRQDAAQAEARAALARPFAAPPPAWSPA